MHFSTLASAAALFQLSIAGYVLEDDYMTDFYGSFDFFTAEDPTHGFVKYVDDATARSMNLINASTTVPVQWGVDTTNTVTDGRPSIRLTSKKMYNTGLVVIDVQHMPFGCGTWPAFWMVGPDWPNGGEIDIVEGVHEQETNHITLHTNSGCSISTDAGAFDGDVATSDCDVNAANQDKNVGCSITQKSTQSYGGGLNNNGGGVYATEWTNDAITVYFFPRGSIPDDVLGDSPNPNGWGTPAAKFTNAGCDIASHFKNQQIVFDTTFCGDWAGNTWSSSSCASKAATCNEYVQNNPSAFTDAFWTINALKVYTNNGDAPTPSDTPTPPESSAVPVPTGETTEVPISSATDLPTIISTVEPPQSSDSSVPTETPLPTSTGFDAPPPFPSETSIPTEAPSLSPSDAPVSSDTPELSSEAPIPSETPAPSGPAPSDASDAPVPSWGSLGWAGHHGRPSETLANEVSAPTGSTDDGAMGNGFQWPAGSSSSSSSSSSNNNEPTSAGSLPSAAPTPPFPVPGNNTMPLPTGTGTAAAAPPAFTPQMPANSSAPAGSVGTAIPTQPQPTDLEAMPSFGYSYGGGDVFETVYQTVFVTVQPTTTPSPTPAAEEEEEEVVETVYQTVVVTVAAPGETPAPGSRMARHARAHRRRMVLHNGRR